MTQVGQLLATPVNERTEAMYLAAIDKNYQSLQYVSEDDCTQAIKSHYFKSFLIQSKIDLNLKREDHVFISSLSVNDLKLITNLLKESAVLGKITLEGGSLICAQIAARKSNSLAYHFNPVVLKSDELSEYLNILKNAEHPIRERFVITGNHWISGEIDIDADGHVSVLYIDSLGYTPYWWFDDAINGSFPNAKIYVPDIKRQHDEVSCMLFALDDVRHLYTIEHYLPSEYKDKDSPLFCYLAASAAARLEEKKGEHKKDSAYILCDLPLSFLRTMQSSKLFGENPDDIIPKRSVDEQKNPVNKNGDLLTPQFARNNFFVKSKEILPEEMCNRIVLLEENAAVKFDDQRTLYLVKENNKLQVYWYNYEKEKYQPHTIVNREQLLNLIKDKQIITPEDEEFIKVASLCGYPREKNIRIENQFKKMVKYNWDFIKAHNIKRTKDHRENFTLKGFENRIKQQCISAIFEAISACIALEIIRLQNNKADQSLFSPVNQKVLKIQNALSRVKFFYSSPKVLAKLDITDKINIKNSILDFKAGGPSLKELLPTQCHNSAFLNLPKLINRQL